ncbi:hypothetical protein LJC20_01255 [Eubacteriales bacterium OttesenSCG-928-M02]|nr:hypothetical protein [Eubacteriales bacterium OttesenSCG-928-M02]
MNKEITVIKKKRNQKAILILLLLLFVAAGIGIAGYFAGWFRKDPGPVVAGELFPDTGADAEDGHLPDMTEEQIKQQMQREADATKFSFKINAQPVFADGNSPGTLRIENPNHNKYPFVVDIYLDGSGEKVYASGGILPNHHINTAKLIKALQKGSHKAKAIISIYDPDTQKYLGESVVNLTLVVNH